jgi:glycosyltransferase involved in cell wall biosynthesis
MSSVSVVIPCYRYGHLLEEAVRSVLDDQDGVDVRVLVIDDASPDDSAAVARRIAARDPRVEVHVHTTNIGHLATYNEGLLDWADGDYSVLLSADDRLTPGALTRAAALLDAQPRVGFVYGNVLWFGAGGPLPRARTRVREEVVWPGQLWLESRFRQAQTGISSPEVVVRTATQKRVGGYDWRLPHLGDAQMWLRLAAHADVGYLRGADQAYYRRHQENMSTALTPLTTLEQYRLAFDSVLERHGDRLPNAQRLADLVHRRLAWEALVVAGNSLDPARSGPDAADELVDFALRCWPEAAHLPVYRTLQLRRRIRPSALRYLKPLALPATAARKGEQWWARREEQSVGEQLRRSWLRRRAAAVSSA